MTPQDAAMNTKAIKEMVDNALSGRIGTMI
jgi:hypothetical protein